MLPFGLRSAPKIFNSVADAVEWCVSKGVDYIFHYLDDFAVVGPPDSDTCRKYLHILMAICRELEIPLAPEKQDGPTAVITLLRIIIDTIRGELRLPVDKLQRLLQTVKGVGKTQSVHTQGAGVSRRGITTCSQGDQTRQVISRADNFPPESSEAATSPHPAECRISIGHDAVANICNTLEWCLPHNPPSKQEAIDYFRCLRGVGMWSMA